MLNIKLEKVSKCCGYTKEVGRGLLGGGEYDGDTKGEGFSVTITFNPCGDLGGNIILFILLYFSPLFSILFYSSPLNHILFYSYPSPSILFLSLTLSFTFHSILILYLLFYSIIFLSSTPPFSSYPLPLFSCSTPSFFPF